MMPYETPARGRAAAVALLAGWAGLASPAASAPARTPPDLNGVWVLADTFMDKQDGTHPSAPGRFDPDDPTLRIMMVAPPKLKGEYAARFKTAQEKMAQGVAVEDPTALCIPQGMPSFWGGPYSWEIIQSGRQLNLFQEWNEQTRRIYLDGRKHPSLDDVDPLYNGHSVGHWEGDTLVVDTVNLVGDTGLMAPGAVHSDAAHITERLRLVGPDLLEVQVKVEDPKALEEPFTFERRLRRKPGMEIQDYVCAENNRHTIDASGATQVILKPK